MRVSFTVGTLQVPPSYFVVQHAELLPQYDPVIHTLVEKIGDQSLAAPVVAAVPGGGVLSYRQRELIEPLFLSRMARQIAARHPDIIHHHHNAWTIPSCKAARKLDAPLFVSLHGGDVDNALRPARTWMQKWHRRNFRASIAAGATFLASSKYLASLAVRAGVPEDSLHVFYHGVDTDYFHPVGRSAEVTSQLTDPTLPLVVSAGRLEYQKGMMDLAQASIRASNDYPHALVLIGKGPMEPQLRALAHQHPHIHVIPTQPRAAIREWMSAADVFVLASKSDNGRRESAGLVTVEAQACATPVLVSDSGGTSEMFLPGTTGILTAENNIAELSTGLQQLLALSPEQRKAMGERGRDFVVKERSLQRSTRELIERYQQALAG